MVGYKQNIISKIKLITGKRYKYLEELINELDNNDNALKQFSSLMNDINFKIIRLEKKSKQFF